jgi:hypothetical protein
MALDAGSLVFVAYADDAPSGTALGTLSEAFDKRVTVEDNGMGSGSFTMSRHSSQASWCTPGNYVRVWRDTVIGDPIAGFWIEEANDTFVSADEDGGEDMTRSGRGPLAVLDEAVVWHRAVRKGSGRVQPGRGRWVWRGGIQLARPLVRMLEEADRRGNLPFVTKTFTRTRDSDGTLWPDETEVRKFVLPIGVTLLELVAILRGAGLHIWMDADFALHALPEYDNDLTATIGFTEGVDIRETVDRERAVRRTRSVALVGGERNNGRERFRAVRDADLETAIGRRKEGFRDYGRTATRAALARVGRRSLRTWKRRKDGPMTLPVIDTTGQVALVDYTVGDEIAVTVGDMTAEPRRITSITLIETEAGEYDPILELDNP